MQDPQGPLWQRLLGAISKVGPPRTSVMRRVWEHADEVGGGDMATEGLAGAANRTLQFTAAMGEGLANTLLETGRAANWLGYAVPKLATLQLPEGHIPAEFDLGIPKTIQEALPEKYAMRLESRLARSGKIGGISTRTGANFLGALPAYVGSAGGGAIGKAIGVPGKAIEILGKPGYKMGQWLTRNVPEATTWTKLAKDLVPAAIGEATGFGLYGYLAHEGEHDERAMQALWGSLAGFSIGIGREVGRVAEIGLLKASATDAQRAEWRKVLDDLEAGKVDFPKWKQLAPKAVNAAIENAGFNVLGEYEVDGKPRAWVEDLLSGVIGGDAEALKRAVSHYAISYPGILAAKGSHPSTARRNQPDLARDASWQSFTEQQKLLGRKGGTFKEDPAAAAKRKWEERYGEDWTKNAEGFDPVTGKPNEPGFGDQGPTGFDQGKPPETGPTQGPQGPTEPTQRPPAQRFHDTLFDAGWSPARPKPDGTMTMRFPGSGEVTMRADGMLEVPTDVFRAVRGDVEIPAGSERVLMEGQVADEFLADLAALSNLRRMRGEAAFGGAGTEIEAGGTWSGSDGEEHTIGIDGEHYSRNSMDPEWRRRDPAAAREGVVNEVAQSPEAMRWADLVATLRDSVPDQPGIDQLEAVVELLRRGDPESENIGQLLDFMLTPWDGVGQVPNADMLAPLLTPANINPVAQIIGRVATGNLSAEAARVALQQALAQSQQPPVEVGPADAQDAGQEQTPPDETSGEIDPMAREEDFLQQETFRRVSEEGGEPEDLSAAPEAPAAKSIAISGAVDWSSQPEKTRRAAAREFVAAARAEGRQIDANTVRDLFQIPRETARDMLGMSAEEAKFEAERRQKVERDYRLAEDRMKDLVMRREIASKELGRLKASKADPAEIAAAEAKVARETKREATERKAFDKMSKELARSDEQNATLRRRAKRNLPQKTSRDAAQFVIDRGGLRAEMDGKRKVGIAGWEKSARVTDDILKMKIGGKLLVREGGRQTWEDVAKALHEEGYAGEEFVDQATGNLDTHAVFEQFLENPRGWMPGHGVEDLVRAEVRDYEARQAEFEAAQAEWQRLQDEADAKEIDAERAAIEGEAEEPPPRDIDEGEPDPWDDMDPQSGAIMNFGPMFIRGVDWAASASVRVLARWIDNWWKIRKDQWDAWIRTQAISIGIRAKDPMFERVARQIMARTRHHQGQAQSRFLTAAKDLVRYRKELGAAVNTGQVTARVWVALTENRMNPLDPSFEAATGIPPAAAIRIADAINESLLYLHDQFRANGVLVMAPDKFGQWTYQIMRERDTATPPRVWNREGRDRVMGDRSLRLQLWQQWVNANPTMRVGQITNPITGKKTAGKPLTVSMLENMYQAGANKLQGPNPERRAAAEMARWIPNVPATFQGHDILEPDVWTAMNRTIDNQSSRLAVHESIGGDYPIAVKKRFGITKPGPTKFLQGFRKRINAGSEDANRDIFNDAHDLFERMQGREPEHVTAAMRRRMENSSVRRSMLTIMAGIHDVPALFGEPFHMAGFVRMAKAITAMYLPPKQRAAAIELAERAGALRHEIGHVDLGEQRGPLATLAQAMTLASNWMEREKTVFFTHFVKTQLLDAWNSSPGNRDDVEMVMDLVRMSETEATMLVDGAADEALQHRFLVEAVQFMTSRGRPAERSRRAASPEWKLQVPFSGWATMRMGGHAREAQAYGDLFSKSASLGRRARLLKRFIRRAFGIVAQGQLGLFFYYVIADLLRGQPDGAERFVRDWREAPWTMFARGTAGQMAGGPMMVLGNAMFESRKGIADALIQMNEPMAVAYGTVRSLKDMARGAASSRDMAELATGLADNMVKLGENTGYVPRFFRSATVATLGFLGLNADRWAGERRIVSQWMQIAGIDAPFSEPQKQPQFYSAMAGVKDLIDSHTGDLGDLWEKIQPDLNDALELQTGETAAAKLRSFQILGRFDREQRQRFMSYRNDPEAYGMILAHDDMISQLAEMVGRLQGTYPRDFATDLDTARSQAGAGARNSWGGVLDRVVDQLSRRMEAQQPLGFEAEDLADAMALYPDSLLRDSALDGAYTLGIRSMTKPELKSMLHGIMIERAGKRFAGRIKDDALKQLQGK